LHRWQQRQRIFRRGADGDENAWPHALAERLVKFRPGRGFKGKMADIAHHAHDLKLFVFRTEILDELPERIFPGESSLCRLFVDDGDGRSSAGARDEVGCHERDARRQ
jgi:hypothetical protein